MQVSYHSILTKIQKLQKKKNKKKKLFFFVPTGIAQNWPIWSIRSVFKPIRNISVSILVYVPLRYIPVSMVLITLVLPPLT